VSASLVADLGIGPEVWVLLSMLGCITLFFKYSRIWSVRNVDLLLLFVLAPGFLLLVGREEKYFQIAFVLLFLGSVCWLTRCLIDLGLSRRPLLEPNLNAAGLTCLSVGILGLLLTETVMLPVNEGAARNPAAKGKRVEPPPGEGKAVKEPGPVSKLIESAPLPSPLKPIRRQEVFNRVLASLAHLGLVAGLITVGWWHFERPVSGLAMATCYLIMPYTRIALVDSSQLVPSALIVTAVVFYQRPALAGGLIGFAAWWMPACLGLLPLWFGFYWGRGASRFATFALAVLAGCAVIGWQWPEITGWLRTVGARSLSQAGMVFGAEQPTSGSLWVRIDLIYRLPVVIAYLTFVAVISIWPLRKNLGELIALSAAVLIAVQFWYLYGGGTLVMLYLPLILLMMFRPNLASKRPLLLESRAKAAR
jgi:hypothetical protein